MITTLDEFLSLSNSNIPSEYHRAQEEPLSEDICKEIIEKHPDLKEWMLVNPHISLRFLEELSVDSDHRVRWNVAWHPNISPEICKRLSKDLDEGVRHRIACNPKTPKMVLKEMLHDVFPPCAEAAKEFLLKRKDTDAFNDV